MLWEKVQDYFRDSTRVEIYRGTAYRKEAEKDSTWAQIVESELKTFSVKGKVEYVPYRIFNNGEEVQKFEIWEPCEETILTEVD